MKIKQTRDTLSDVYVSPQNPTPSLSRNSKSSPQKSTKTKPMPSTSSYSSMIKMRRVSTLRILPSANGAGFNPACRDAQTLSGAGIPHELMLHVLTFCNLSTSNIELHAQLQTVLSEKLGLNLLVIFS